MIDESTLIEIKPEKSELKNNNKNIKEILSNLLKKRLEHKLSKLEKKNSEETNALLGIIKTSQNIMTSLESYSDEVRKELYKIRHKNDENYKKKSQGKKSNLMNSENNNIESLENILENNSNNISSVLNTNNKIKRPSKSIEAKKAKQLILTPEINNKEKKTKKEKQDVFSRLASKSIGNFKKSKFTITENSKPKNKKIINVSKKKTENIINKKNDIINKEDKNTPSRPEKKGEKDKSLLLKLTSTPKAKTKISKRLSKYNLDNSNTLNNSNSNSNNTLRIKNTHSKGNLIKKIKKRRKKK